MPSDLALKGMNLIHKTILTLSGGRAGWNAGNMPVIKLTTTGRKSGQPREVMLTCPAIVDGSFVIVASRGGDDVHPAWYLNLRDNPIVEVESRDQPKHQRRARVGSSTEREALWSSITSKYSGYAGYQAKTSREIPIVFLDKI